MAVRITKATRAAFFAALAAGGTVAGACRTAAISESTVYRLRREDAEFREGFEAAFDEACARIEVLALDWAMNGVPKTVVVNGKTSRRREITPGFALQVLARRAAGRVAAPAEGGPDAAAALDRLRGTMELMATRLAAGACPRCGTAA